MSAHIYRAKRGFTLLELLVVIAIIVILAALLLPALGRTKESGHAAQCLDNTRQLTVAWLEYALDFGEGLPFNVKTATNPMTSGQPPPGPSAPGTWAPGTMTWGVGLFASFIGNDTNVNAMMTGQLGPYAVNASIYHCPSDTSIGRGQHFLRERSTSMNAFVGDKSSKGSRTTTWSDTWANFLKLHDFNIPARTFVFADEHPDSINDGYLIIPPADGVSNMWQDLPASYHNGAGTFSFADGHVEIHKWLNPSTRKTINKVDQSGLPLTPPPNQMDDLTWVLQRMSPR